MCVLEWQKQEMHIGMPSLYPGGSHPLICSPYGAKHVAFSHREGIVLSTITYNDDGVLRRFSTVCALQRPRSHQVLDQVTPGH
jgi:hypothetical protein